MSSAEATTAVSCVAALVSAYHNGSLIVASIKARRRRRNMLQPIVLLEESLQNGATEVVKAKDDGVNRHGPAFARGDDIATSALKSIEVDLLRAIVDHLIPAREDDKLVDFAVVVDASDLGRAKALAVLHELYMRAAQAQPIQLSPFSLQHMHVKELPEARPNVSMNRLVPKPPSNWSRRPFASTRDGWKSSNNRQIEVSGIDPPDRPEEGGPSTLFSSSSPLSTSSIPLSPLEANPWVEGGVRIRVGDGPLTSPRTHRTSYLSGPRSDLSPGSQPRSESTDYGTKPSDVAELGDFTEHGRYCKGAYFLQRGFLKGAFRLRTRSVSKQTMDYYWKCCSKQCVFEVPAVKHVRGWRFNDDVMRTSGVEYRWLFTAKSHVCQGRAKVGRTKHTFKCFICHLRREDQSIFQGVQNFLIHTASHYGQYIGDTLIQGSLVIYAEAIRGVSGDDASKFDFKLPPSLETEALSSTEDDPIVPKTIYFHHRYNATVYPNPAVPAKFEREFSSQDQLNQVCELKTQDELDYQDELTSSRSNDLPSLAYTGSKASAIELIDMSGILANRFAQVILNDGDLKPLCDLTLQKIPYARLEHNVRRLLDEYTADLLKEAKQNDERSAADAMKRHSEKVVELLCIALDPNEASKAAGMVSPCEQQTNKDEIKGWLSETSRITAPLDTDAKLDHYDISSKSSDEEDALIGEFESIKPFLCNGAAFSKLKEDFRKFLSLQTRDLGSANLKLTNERHNAEDFVTRQLRLGNEVKAAPKVTTPQEHCLEIAAPQSEPEESAYTPTQPIMHLVSCDMKPSFGNHSKVLLERILGRSLLWWPFGEPLRPLASGLRRYLWKCTCLNFFFQDCGSNVYFDVSLSSQSDKAGTVSVASVGRPFLSAGNSQSLPLHNAPSASGQAMNSSGQPSVPAFTSNRAPSTPSKSRNQPVLSSGQSSFGTQRSGCPGNEQFIYWCIGEGDTYAQSVELNAGRLTDHSFSNRLLSEYATVKGRWYRFWTMTSCSRASFKKFRYLYDDRNLVNFCSEDPGFPNDPQLYQYTTPSLRVPISPEIHRGWVESKIEHHLQEHAGVKWPWSTSHVCSSLSTTSSTGLLQYIPKKLPPGLEAKELNEGYGLQAVARIAVWRIVAMLLLWQSGSVMFLIYWLTRHPGDLQNAFTVLTTTMAGFGMYLAILARFHK